MQAGRLKDRVVLQRPVETRTATGGVVIQYQDWLTVWARVEDLTPRERFLADQVQSDITTRIRLRYRPGLTAKMRVKHQRQAGSPTDVNLYDVAGPPIEVMGARREIQLMCIRRDAEGFRTGSN